MLDPVVTGVGVVAPNGVGTEAWWEATLASRSGIRRIERFEPERYGTTLAGEVDAFEPTEHIEQRLIVQTDRWTWFGLAAAEMAMADAGFEPSTEPDYRTSVITASSSGGNEFGQREIGNLWGKGPGFVGAYQSIAWFYAATTGQISIRHKLKGTCGVVVAEGAGGLEALWQSRRTIARGGVDTVISGGTEAPIGPYALTCQLQTGMLSTADDPAEAYRPFDARANGYVPGEGGAILLVESREHAASRGASPYGEIAGYGATQDAHHWLEPAPDGKQLARAMRLALERARVAPGDVDVVFADAAGTPAGDRAEAAALQSVFEEEVPPVTAPKTMVGRLYAGGAALDTTAALLALRDGVIPPTVNVDSLADGCELDVVVGGPREAPLATALVVARGLGGFNSALVVRKASSGR